MHTLALFTEPPPFRPHPALERWLFESSALTALILLGLAALVFFTLRSATGPESAKRATPIAGAIALAALLVYALGWVIETERESAIDTAQALVEAASEADAGAIERILAPTVSVRAAGAPIAGLDREWLVGAVSSFEQLPVAILGTEIQKGRASLDPSGQRAATNMRITAGGDGQGRAITWWRVELANSGDGWRIDTLDLLLVNGDPPASAISRQFSRYGGERGGER